MKTVDELIYPSDKLQNNRLIFGEEVKKIRMDIGLSSSGPFSAEWLKNNDDVGVIGVEANPHCVEHLVYGGTKNGMEDSLLLFYNKVSRYIGEISEGFFGTQVMKMSPDEWDNSSLDWESMPVVYTMGDSVFRLSPLCETVKPTPFRNAPVFKDVKDITDRFILFKAGILNTKDLNAIENKTFYSTYPSLGNSSFNKEFLDPCPDKTIEETFEVPCLSLYKVFSYIDWNRFPYIECIKIDVEGMDLEVLKSAGDKIEKVVYFRVEAFDEKSENDLAINPEDGEEIIRFLESKGFELFDRKPGDFKFVNRSLKEMVSLMGYSWD